MRVIAFYIIVLSISSTLLGQEDTIIFDPIDFNESPSQYAPNTDLTEHGYWKNYLIGYGKKSILTDSTISEAYRLIYWGNYFSIVEIIEHDGLYYITADSSSWGTRNYLIYKSQDTLSINPEIKYIYRYCDAHKEDRIEIGVSNEESFVLDDRDNWAFEYKIDGHYRSLEGIDTNKELKSIYVRMMKLGDLSGYRIYLQSGGYKDY